jgi:ferredoxin
MCADRIKKGGSPACVENCPEEALTFGRRSDLIETAHKRIAEKPDQYVAHVYGEREAGGTSWMYLAGVPFDQIGFRKDMGETAYPMLTTGFLYNVPAVLTLVPPLLLALSKVSERKAEAEPRDKAPQREEDQP